MHKDFLEEVEKEKKELAEAYKQSKQNKKDRNMKDKNTNPDDVKTIIINNKDGTKSVGIEYKDRFGKIVRGKTGLTKDRARENWKKTLPHLPYPDDK